MIDKKLLGELSGNLISNPDNFMDSFRKNLFMYIDRKEITLAQLAEDADMPASTLRSFLYGTANDCHVSTVVKLARALNISCDELLGSGTISNQTCKSLQVLRTLPESFTHFIRWEIHFHKEKLSSGKVSNHAIEVMESTCGESGNMKMTNEMDIVDISHLSDEIRPRVFMGIRISCESYEPIYYKGDILLLANDRKPRNSEHIVVNMNDNMWILKQKEEIINNEKRTTYYSIRDGRKRPVENENGFVLGYVVSVLRNNDLPT